MKRQDDSPDASAMVGPADNVSGDEWKHPLQTLAAYSEAIGRWARQSPLNRDEIELALEGIDGAVGQLRGLLTNERLRPA